MIILKVTFSFYRLVNLAFYVSFEHILDVFIDRSILCLWQIVVDENEANYAES